MKIIKKNELIKLVEKIYIESCIKLPDRVKKKLNEFHNIEKNILAKNVYNDLIENYHISEKEMLPLCQDTGYPEYFVTIGRNIKFEFDIQKAIFEGTKIATINGFLRPSILRNPFVKSSNTLYNIPPVIHYDFADNDKLKIICFPKGGGCENVSKLFMLNPSVSKSELVNIIIDALKNDISQSCPPIFIGICIGGTFTTAPLYAKLSFLKSDKSKEILTLKKIIIKKLNSLNIGPMGYGGKYTVLDLFIVLKPLHIATFPVAINVNCHCLRYSIGEL